MEKCEGVGKALNPVSSKPENLGQRCKKNVYESVNGKYVKNKLEPYGL